MSILTTKVDSDLGLTIPDDFARELGISPNSEVWIRRMGASIVISVPREPSALDELLSRVNETNLHGETDTGSPRGKEIV